MLDGYCPAATIPCKLTMSST